MIVQRVARKGLARVRPTRFAVEALAFVLRGNPASLRVIRSLRLLDPRSDPLPPRYSSLAPKGSGLVHPVLAKLLADREFGLWALNLDVVGFIGDEIARTKPSLILEFGSGSSTVIFAQLMADLHGSDDCLRVISIEQNAEFVTETTSLLERAGLARHVRVIHAPLRRQVIEGIETNCYDIPDGAFGPADGAIDLIVVDGPAAESGARFGTLPLARPLIAGDAVFLLDDALRDSEIDTATMWACLPYVHLEGIFLIGKGVLRGTIRGGQSARTGR